MRLKSNHDMLGLVAELNLRRMLLVPGAMARRNGGSLQLPDVVVKQMTIARQLHHRYERGDYHHESREVRPVIELCQWLAEQHALLHGQTPKDVRIVPETLEGKVELPPGSYAAVIQALAAA